LHSERRPFVISGLLTRLVGDLGDSIGSTDSLSQDDHARTEADSSPSRNDPPFSLLQGGRGRHHDQITFCISALRASRILTGAPAARGFVRGL